MAVRGRNLSNDAREYQVVCTGNAANVLAVTPNNTGWLFCANRSSVQLGEVGVTVVGASGGGPGAAGVTTGAFPETISLKMIQNGAPVTVIEIAIPVATSVYSEFTTRDGTASWASGYQNASDRVFPKGTQFVVMQDQKSGDYDAFAVTVAAHEYGAPPQ